MNKRILFTFLSALTIISGTVLAIRYAQGYRPTTKGMTAGTGLLAANSFPNGASVYINGELTTATDTTLNLSPGDYDIEVKKDGYTTWKKKVHLEKELVTQTNAMLFPIAPSLSSLTVTGAQNITPAPDGQQLLFTTASASSVRSNGIYILDLTDSPLALQKGSRQIAQTPAGWDISTSEFFWSPDGEEILMVYGNRNLLLTTSRMNVLENLPDVTNRKEQIVSQWQEQSDKKYNLALSRFPQEVINVATSGAKHVYLSPDQDRIIYTATASAVLAENLIPQLPAANSQPQTRTITPGNVYVYDRHEDRNFLIVQAPLATPDPSPTPIKRTTTKTATPAPVAIQEQLSALEIMRNRSSGFFTNSPQWLPDSKHIILAIGNTIDISEYDGTNRTRIYSGPFFENFVYPWPNGSKLIILTNFSQTESSQYNLYAVGLK